MKTVRGLLRRFVREEDGVTLIEYALIAALIAVVCIAAITLLGTASSTKFNQIGTEIQNAGTTP